MISLIQLTENDKRLIIVLLLVFILLFVIIGYISLLVEKIMKFQATKTDDMMSDVYKTGVVSNEKEFRRYGIKKNWIIFFRQSFIPFAILIIAWAGFFCYCFFDTGVNGSIDWPKYFKDLFDYGSAAEGQLPTDGKGITTLFYIHDWANAEKIDFWGLKVYGGFPPLLNAPHWSWDAWFSYLFVPANAVGIVWLLICVQGYIARSFRMFKLSWTLYKKTLGKPMRTNLENIKPSANDNLPTNTK